MYSGPEKPPQAFPHSEVTLLRRTMIRLEEALTRPEFESIDLDMTVAHVHDRITEVVRGLNTSESERGENTERQTERSSLSSERAPHEMARRKLNSRIGLLHPRTSRLQESLENLQGAGIVRRRSMTRRATDPRGVTHVQGFFVGRFQPFHLGHRCFVTDIAKEVDEIVVGSEAHRHLTPLKIPSQRVNELA